MVLTALLAGLAKISIWWVLIPAFFAGSLSLSNGPHYQRVVDANLNGIFWYFPTMLLIHIAGKLVIAGVVYAITVWLS
jgi:hypothetical protein